VTALTVAKKDLKGVSRSRALWAVATVLGLLSAVVAFTFPGSASGAEIVRRMFGTLGTMLSILLPIIALIASYRSIVGERQSGGIKFLLGFPNTRRDVLLGKLASRLTAIVAAIVLVFVAASVGALARHAALPISTVLGLFLLSVLYGSVFVVVAVALSAGIAGRGRAIAAAVGSYLVLVILYAIPTVRISGIARWLHTSILGFEANPDLYNAVTYTSPYIAFQKGTNLVFPEELHQTVFRRPTSGATAGTPGPSELPAYLTDEFSLVVFAVWLVVPLVLGYMRFERLDID